MKPSEVLQKGWTTNLIARDKNGHCISAHSPDATSWCFIGAAQKVLSPGEFIQFINLARAETGYMALSEWNDWVCRSQQEAIEIAKRVEAKMGL